MQYSCNFLIYICNQIHFNIKKSCYRFASTEESHDSSLVSIHNIIIIDSQIFIEFITFITYFTCTAFLEFFKSSCDSYYHIERSRETFLVIIYNSSLLKYDQESTLEFRFYVLVTLAIMIKLIIMFISLLTIQNSTSINHASVQKTS